MSFEPLTEIKVGLDFGGDSRPVARLAALDHQIYFEYERDFLRDSLPLSPFRLPLRTGVQSFEAAMFEGLPGVFNDSLPDGWGRLLFDRAMRREGVLPEELSPLDRLAHVGLNGMGALTYEPDASEDDGQSAIDLDALASASQEVLEGSASDVLNELLALNGSSGGARPKALIGFNPDDHNVIHGARNLPDEFEPWMVKFANTQDGPDAGAIEYVYALMAKKAGLDMMPAILFPAANSAGYFATKRFDREGPRRLHMHTVCGLLHADFRVPSLDYQDILTLGLSLTKDVREVEKLYRLAVFNVLAHNRDDHSKNISFLMDESGSWRAAPAYDLTFSSGPRGEQSMMVMGEGRTPSIEHLRALGRDAKISDKAIAAIIDQTLAALSEWSALAEAHGVSHDNTKLIETRMRSSVGE